MKTTKEFYDNLSSSYSEAIIRCVPRYEEMLKMLFAYLPDDFQPENILELGSGTGNLTELIARTFPRSRIIAVDISDQCLQECRKRMKGSNVEFIAIDFMDIVFPEESFDLIMSSISIHHLPDENKRKLFESIYDWLTGGGILSFLDQFRGETGGLYRRHIDFWKEYALGNGVAPDEWERWMEHQRDNDHHSPLRIHLRWLEEVGFRRPDCLWRYLLWSVVNARKEQRIQL